MKTVYSEKVECGPYRADVIVCLQGGGERVAKRALKEFEKFIENLYKIRTETEEEENE